MNDMKKRHAASILVYQRIEDFTAIEDARFPRQRLRNNLKRYGLRGEALERELERIAAGPIVSLGLTAESLLQRCSEALPVEYPYGWRKPEMTRLMKRIFHGFQKTKFLVVYDELPYYLQNASQPPACATVVDQLRRRS